MNIDPAADDIQNSKNADVNWLFLDLNSFFASCEQQEQPELRGKPIAIVQMMTDSTCAIAASYEAKARGVRTGTNIGEAKRICPGLILVKARHKIYVRYHHRIIAAVDNCLPVTKVASIDEMAYRLMGAERVLENAVALAHKVKRTICEQVGERMTCSIGLAPSAFLGKVASDMQKPNGLVAITQKDLPHVLYRLKLTDLNGIGRRMEQRLNEAGIMTVEQLMQSPRARLRQVWGGVHGVLYYELLHGADLQRPESAHSQSISHQHVLEPQFRNRDGARRFSHHLLAKAAERVRHKGYYARRLGLQLTWHNYAGRWWDETGFHETQDTDFLLARLEGLWRAVPATRPMKVGVVLFGLRPAAQHQPDLFAAAGNHQKLSPLVDAINHRYGKGSIGFGLPEADIRAFTGHAAFQRVPEEFEF
jgi:DNA polymerase-4